MKKITLTFLTGTLSLLSFSLFAASAQSGVFLGIDGGWAATNHPSVPGYSSSNQNYTGGASIGYNYAIANHISTGVEANYSDFGKTNYSSTAGSGNFKNSALQLLLSGTYLMDNGFNTFVKVGAANQQTSLSVNNSETGVTSWLPAAAAGLGYEVMKNLNVYGQYEHTFGSDWSNTGFSNPPSKGASLNVFSVGVNYTLPM